MSVNGKSWVAVFFLLAVAIAGHAQESADSIIAKMDEKQKVEWSKAEMTMMIYPEADNPRNVRLFKVLSYGKGESDSYMMFQSPKSIQGLSILSKDDDQWVYFPSTGRVRKIAGKSKKESVKGVGGDFSYEDLGGGNMREKYGFKILRENDGSWTLEGIPKKSDSSYSKMIIEVDKSKYLPLKIEFYTPEDGHLKDMVMQDIKSIGGRETPTKIEMRNLKKNSMTVIITTAAQYNSPVDEKYFSPTRFYK